MSDLEATPASSIGAADGLFAEVCDALAAELIPLGIDQWSQPVVDGMTVRDVVIHLTAVNEVLVDRLRTGAIDPIDVAVLDAATDAARGRDAGLTQVEVLSAWQRSIDHVVKCAASTTEVGWIALVVPSSIAVVDRAFETWIHANDIRNAIGRASLDPSARHLRVLCEVAVTLLPLAHATSGGTRAATLQLALTGPGGGEWTVELGTAHEPRCSAFMAAAARDLCLLMGDRIDPRDFACTVRGDDEAAVVVGELVHGAKAFSRL